MKVGFPPYPQGTTTSHPLSSKSFALRVTTARWWVRAVAGDGKWGRAPLPSTPKGITNYANYGDCALN